MKFKITYNSKYVLGKNLINTKKTLINNNINFGLIEGGINLNTNQPNYALDLGFVEATTNIAPTIKPEIIAKPLIIVTPRTGGQNINYNYVYLFVFSISIMLVNKYKSKLFKK
jgi:Ni2+-binding GTPase involved in maturation of urease and hydrogenase